MFEHAASVIRAGEVVVEDGEIRATPNGRLLHVAPSFDEGVVPHIREWFRTALTRSTRKLRGRRPLSTGTRIRGDVLIPETGDSGLPPCGVLGRRPEDDPGLAAVAG